MRGDSVEIWEDAFRRWQYEEALYGAEVCAAFWDYCYLERQVLRMGRMWQGDRILWARIRRWIYTTIPTSLVEKRV